MPMPYYNEIITAIDSAIVAGALTDKRFQNKKFAGLCYLTPVKIEGQTLTAFVPAKIKTLNDYEIIAPDDKFNLITYHRLLSSQHQRDIDQFGAMRTTSEMVLTVISFTSKVNLIADQLEALFLAGFPVAMSKPFTEALKMQSINVDVISSAFDNVSIFNTEYRGQTYFLKPQTVMFQIRYRIEATYSKTCLTLCCEPES